MFKDDQFVAAAPQAQLELAFAHARAGGKAEDILAEYDRILSEPIDTPMRATVEMESARLDQELGYGLKGAELAAAAQRDGWASDTQAPFTEAECYVLAGQKDKARVIYQSLIATGGTVGSDDRKANVRNEAKQALTQLDAPLPSPRPSVGAFKVGEKAPAIEEKDLDGKRFSLDAHKGKVILLDFWATWCGPCRAALPQVRETYNKLKDKGFVVLGVSADDDIPTLKKFMAEQGMTWPQFADSKGIAPAGGGWNNALMNAFGITGIPTMVLIDQQGIVRAIHVGAGEDLKTEVEKLLKGGAIPVVAPPPPPVAAPGLDAPRREAFELEHKYRNPATPIPASEIKRTIALGPDDKWLPADLIAYFNAHKTPEQKAIAVMVKTELCCDNGYRACAVTSAVLEKTHPELMVFSAWIKHPDTIPSDPKAADAKRAWDEQVAREYAFEQGPGATIVFIDPNTGKRVRTDAQQMNLYQDAYDKSGGTTPVFDAKVSQVLDVFARAPKPNDEPSDAGAPAGVGAQN